MDNNRLIEVLIGSIFSGGGTVAIINWIRARQSRKRGMSHNEKVAASQAKHVPVAMGTPDWEALTRYWQAELKLTREDFRKYRLESDKRHRADQERIDQLETHIWEQKGAPPPPDTRGK